MTMFAFLDDMPRAARLGLLGGTALVLLAAAFVLWWLFTPRYQLLFGNLRETDAAEVTQSLTAWKVPYRFTDDGGAIEVPKDQVYDTRMKLVSAGIPSGGHVGFELFNDSDFGVTDFAQRVNYQRALQGELERSIAALPGVESVRVHLTIRRPGLFVGQNDTSKASVAVGMAPGELLTQAQVRGIRSLVASGVDGLEPSSVVVLGPTGVLAGGSTAAAGNNLLSQNEEQSGYEQRLRERISDLLSQVFHLSNYRVSVDVRLNFDQVRRVSERLIPQGEGGNGLVTRKRTSRSGGAAGSADATPSQDQDEVDFAHGTEREELSRAPGQVERVSVAVLVPPTLAPMQLERLKRLVSAAAGLDLERGDRLEIGAITEEQTPTKVSQNPLLATAEPEAEAEREVAEVAVSTGPMTSWQIAWLGAALATGLLLGWALGGLRSRGPRPLSHEERQAMVVKVRSWLAEGDAA